MTTDEDAVYLLQRMITSFDAAKKAGNPAARAVHLELAGLYHERWLTARKDDATAPTRRIVLPPLLNPRHFPVESAIP